MIPRDSFVTQPAEVRRLTGNNAKFLARLQQGPATRRELVDLVDGGAITQRISDLRKAGYDIQCREDRDTGASTYVLVRGVVTRGADLNAPVEGRLI